VALSIYRTLKPGGWIEIQDMRWAYGSDDNTVVPEYAPQKMMELVQMGLAALGIDSQSTEKHFERLTNAGFANIGQFGRSVPVGLWPAVRQSKQMGMYCRTHTLDGLEAVMLGPLTRGLGWSKERVEEFSSSVRSDLLNPSIHSYVYFQALWAQRPLDLAES
jgi:hypothetical protein